MSENLEAKAKVALDLLSQGAEEVSIVGTDITVIRKAKASNNLNKSSGTTQVVNVNTYATSNSSSNLTVQFSILRQELRETYKDDHRINKLNQKITEIEKELKKNNPNKNNLKKYLKWLLDFGWDAFAKLAPIVIEKLTATL